ncbi:MAG: patatin-like phospholipase family protein [Micropruina sp.]|nr:patatin-like phospholipase family protein [Micropruina sp.]
MKNIPQALWALTERATPDHYRRATLMFADPAPKPLPPPESVRHQPVRPSADLHPVYPWQNLTFEGGGAKGYAYIGAIQALEKAGLYPTYIRRIAGTSVGSMLALFATLGVSSEEMIARVPADLQALVMDGGGGRVGSMARTAVTRGCIRANGRWRSSARSWRTTPAVRTSPSSSCWSAPDVSSASP